MVSELPLFDAPPGGRLTAEMGSAYESHGFLILRDFVPREACVALQQRALELVDAFDPASVSTIFSTGSDLHQADSYFQESGDKIRFFLENGAFDEQGRLRQSKEDSLNKIGHAMHDLDPVFGAFSRTPKLASLVRSIGIQDPAIIQSMYIFKPPRIGGEVLCHQDSTFIYTEPESCVGLWFALEDATLENGCLHFIPGGHKGPLRKRNRRDETGALVYEVLDDTPFAEERKVPVEAPQGTLVVFNGRSPHLSGPNCSDKSRHAYTLHVIDRNCHYPADNWLQRRDDLPLRGFDS